MGATPSSVLSTSSPSSTAAASVVSAGLWEPGVGGVASAIPFEDWAAPVATETGTALPAGEPVTGGGTVP